MRSEYIYILSLISAFIVGIIFFVGVMNSNDSPLVSKNHETITEMADNIAGNGGQVCMIFLDGNGSKVVRVCPEDSSNITALLSEKNK